MSSIDDVLQQVARGELTPDEALALLGPGIAAPVEADNETADAGDEPPAYESGSPLSAARADPVRMEKPIGAPPAGDGPPPYQPPPPGAAPEPDGPVGGTGLRVVRVRTLARALEIYADPAVAEVQVTHGSPSLRRTGDTIVVEPTGGSYGPGARFSFVRSIATLPGLDERIVLRVNPDLLVDIDISAVSLRVWGCEGGLRLRLAASSAKLDRVSGPLTIDAHSSSVKGTSRLTGESNIRCESSSIKLGLLEGSDVTIRSSNRMGKVVVPRQRTKSAHGEARGFSKVGAGNGRLTIDATMSSVTLGRDL